MMKIDQSAFPQPDRSWLRKMSLNTMISSQIQMKNRKNQSIDQNTWPAPHSAATNMNHSSSVVGRHHRRPILRSTHHPERMNSPRVGGSSEGGDAVRRASPYRRSHGRQVTNRRE